MQLNRVLLRRAKRWLVSGTSLIAVGALLSLITLIPYISALIYNATVNSAFSGLHGESLAGPILFDMPGLNFLLLASGAVLIAFGSVILHSGIRQYRKLQSLRQLT